MKNKPITMVKVTHGYNLFVNNVPVVPRSPTGITFHREKAGLKPSKEDAAIPEGKRPLLIKKKSDALGLAHQIGRYIFDLGDFVQSYVEPVGWSFKK